MTDANDNIVSMASHARSRPLDERELLTIVFTDLVDSTQLQTEVGDAESVRLSDKHREIVRRLLYKYRGHEIDWAGDSCLASFRKPSDAVSFAVAMLAEHRAVRESEPQLPQVRVGMHLGEIVVRKLEGGGRDSKDLFGLQVSEASRVMSLARGDQIFCTQSVFDSARLALRGQQVEGCESLQWVRHGLYELKGSPEPLEICEVGEENFAPFLAPESNEKCRKLVEDDAPALRIGKSRVWMIAAAMGIVVFGLATFVRPNWGPQRATPVESGEPLQTGSGEVRRYTILLPAEAPIAPAETVLNFNLAMAPNGKHLVYRSLDGAVAHLVLCNLSDVSAKRLEGTEGARFPFYSPDSRWVGYFSTEDQKLKKVPVDGGPPIVLCDGFFYAGAHWGDNGYIVFSNGGQGIMRVSEDGGTPEQLTKPDPEKGETFHSHPHALPDGKGILFSISPAIDVSTMRTGLLLPDRSDYTLLDGVGGTAQYLPTGHLLSIKFGVLIAQPFDLETLEFKGAAVPVTEEAMVGSDGTTRHYGYSMNGTLAYVPDEGSIAESNQLAWMSHDGGMTTTKLATKSYVIPRVSPDGRRITVSAHEAVGRDIWICDLEDESLMRLTLDRGEDWHPIWTPDGNNVVFASGRTGTLNLYMRAADGTGTAKRLTESAYHQWPHTWSEDGRELIFVERNFDTGYDIWAVPVDGSDNPRPIIHTTANENNPDVSKDGRWIAYQTNESGQYEIYIQPYPELSERWQVSTQGGNQACWSPDGSTLYFRHGVQMLRAIIRADPELVIGDPEVVFESDAIVLASEARNYDIDLDGTRFLVLKNIESGPRSTVNRELRFVENWFKELKRVAPPFAN